MLASVVLVRFPGQARGALSLHVAAPQSVPSTFVFSQRQRKVRYHRLWRKPSRLRFALRTWSHQLLIDDMDESCNYDLLRCC
ncbi:MAG: hypothetical protein ACI83P_000949 [Janthinobacterium sp.]|jgi:hypothetical protein